MYPEQPQPPTQPAPPQDYLNQISTQPVKKPGFSLNLKFVIIVGAILVIAVIIVAIVVNVLVQSARQPLQQLSARLDSTSAVVEGAQKKLKSSQLRSLNSSLNLYLTDINSDITAPLGSAGIDEKKITEKITQGESLTALTDRLEDARLNAIYDRTYAREMAYQLDRLITLMKEISTSTSSAELKEFLNNTYPTLEPTQKAFSEFNAANG
jgi:hypothetical protein